MKGAPGWRVAGGRWWVKVAGRRSDEATKQSTEQVTTKLRSRNRGAFMSSTHGCIPPNGKAKASNKQ